MEPTFLLYGANGYTAGLIARRAVERGLRPILAGRSREKIEPLAQALGLPVRPFALEDPAAVAAGLDGMAAVLHCAGPFAHTAASMVAGCLRARVHYLDITGEIAVFEALAARDAEARAAGVMLLPGVGFDVVPSDCLAAHLKARLPAATQLTLGFHGLGGVSRGTATTMAENIHRGGMVRRDGVLTPVPAAWKTRAIDFGLGPVQAVTLPWGDVATAWHSTGIPDIEVYAAVTGGQYRMMVASRYLGWLLGTALVQGYIRRKIQARPAGPSDARRGAGMSLVWGEVRDAAGRTVVARLHGPEGYTWTAQTAVAAIEIVLAGKAPAGFQTPSRAFGADFVLAGPGVERTDEE